MEYINGKAGSIHFNPDITATVAMSSVCKPISNASGCLGLNLVSGLNNGLINFSPIKFAIALPPITPVVIMPPTIPNALDIFERTFIFSIIPNAAPATMLQRNMLARY